MNLAQQGELKRYSAYLQGLTDDQLIDERHASLNLQAVAANDNRDVAYSKAVQTEAAMVQRFGLENAYRKYATKYPTK